ncbi:MAG: hypothetical protein JXN59_11460, partial [Anaerolineae bacterium]|nr:hypothetical protein [Anaerolineae bacterium]
MQLWVGLMFREAFMRTFRLLIFVLLPALILSGCFQPAGEGIQATPVGQGVVEPPTNTASP